MFAAIILPDMKYSKFGHLNYLGTLVITHEIHTFSNYKYMTLFFSFVHAPECAYCSIGKLVNCEFYMSLIFQLCTHSGMC